MTKKIYIIFFTGILIFLNGCAGYEPIFSSKKIQFVIEDFLIEGDSTLSKKIFSKLDNLSKSQKNNQDARSIKININSSKNKTGTNKSSSGKVLEYKITLNISVKISDYLTNRMILNKTFISSTSYKVQDQYFDTVRLEKTSEENLINNIYQNLLITLSQNI
tara:strand:+ start:1899 stop:2384 length:486 start_codon:yes stop_codon:yes gene_type:complete